MDNINLTNYVAVFWEADTADTGHIKWVRADQPHSHYAIYLSWNDAFKARQYYDYLARKNEYHNIEGPLELISLTANHYIDAMHIQSEPIVALHIDNQSHQLVKSTIIDDDDVVILMRESVADALIRACSIDLDLYFFLHSFMTQLAIVVLGEPS